MIQLVPASSDNDDISYRFDIRLALCSEQRFQEYNSDNRVCNQDFGHIFHLICPYYRVTHFERLSMSSNPLPFTSSRNLSLETYVAPTPEEVARYNGSIAEYRFEVSDNLYAALLFTQIFIKIVKSFLGVDQATSVFRHYRESRGTRKHFRVRL